MALQPKYSVSLNISMANLKVLKNVKLKMEKIQNNISVRTIEGKKSGVVGNDHETICRGSLER